VYTFELPTVAPEHGTIVGARPPELLEKLSLEGRYGSGHQNDVPDHGPVYHTPSEQPRPIGLPPYKRPHELADSAH
ncbi:MAG: hypothetical protein D6776_09445, partial [Planctomycetota bacterium]